MNTKSLIEFLMEHPVEFEWLPFTATYRKKPSDHWFKVSRKGGTCIFHKVEENGPSEGFAQDTMIEYYRKYSWKPK